MEDARGGLQRLEMLQQEPRGAFRKRPTTLPTKAVNNHGILQVKGFSTRTGWRQNWIEAG
jgi:hypothetical protein